MLRVPPAAAAKKSPSAAPQNEATSAEHMQPVPVTPAISGEPLRRNAVCFPSETASTAPVTAATHPNLSAARAAASRSACGPLSRSASETSTPFAAACAPATKRISDRLPRIAAKRISLSRRSTVRFRSGDAPAPTGSSTTGIPLALAAFPAASMDSTVRVFSVPMLSTTAEARAAMSAASAISSAMMGEAPIASVALAQSLTVT